MKILHIVGSLDSSAGGPSRSVPQTCEQVSQLGVNIELVARPSTDPVKVNTSDNFKVKYLSIFELIRFGFSLSTKENALIHLQHVWDPYIHIMAWFARVKGIPYIITPRGMLEPWIMNHNPLKKKLGMFLYQKRDLNKATFIHATCEMEKENIRKRGFKNPVTIIPNGVDISKFPNHPPKKALQPKKILFLSRIHQKKGIEFLIEAWVQLDSKLRKDWKVEIIGNGEESYIESLQQKINNYKLQEQIVIKSPVFGKEKIKIFRDASLFVLPTYSENFGIVVAEALASYTPVITTKGTPWEELETEQCGWWINIGVEPLIKAITEAIQTSDEDIVAMGLKGRNLVETKYDIKAVAKEMKSLYNQIDNQD